MRFVESLLSRPRIGTMNRARPNVGRASRLPCEHLREQICVGFADGAGETPALPSGKPIRREPCNSPIVKKKPAATIQKVAAGLSLQTLRRRARLLRLLFDLHLVQVTIRIDA